MPILVIFNRPILNTHLFQEDMHTFLNTRGSFQGLIGNSSTTAITAKAKALYLRPGLYNGSTVSWICPAQVPCHSVPQLSSASNMVHPPQRTRYYKVLCFPNSKSIQDSNMEKKNKTQQLSRYSRRHFLISVSIHLSEGQRYANKTHIGQTCDEPKAR